MGKGVNSVFLVCFLVSLASFSSASFISLTPQVVTEPMVLSDETTINFSVSNSGDEPAYDVFVSLLLPEGIHSDNLFVGRLNNGESYSSRFRLQLSNASAGFYSVPMVIDYKDANGHPFSAVYVFSFAYKQAYSSKITAKVSDLSLCVDCSGVLKLTLRNLDSVPHRIKAKLIVPREFSAEPEERNIELKPKSSSEEAFVVSSLDALAGSTYIVSVIFLYEEDGVHYSSYSNSVIKVVERKALPVWMPVVLLFALVLVFIFYQIKK